MNLISFFIPPSQRRLTLQAAQAEATPVLIHGASGTGKGAIARWIHSNGSRAASPFLTTTAQTPVTEQLIAAQGGTLVLQELGEYPLAEQKVLENFLKTKTVQSSQQSGVPRLLNVRLIATTSQSLDKRAQSGLFNAELLERFNEFRIEMPSLSKRQDEFEDIALGLVEEITHELHKEHIRGISPQVLEKLKSYEWPGNVRELRNVLRVSVVTAKGSQLELSDLPEFGHDRIDFRATRAQFEKIYLLELLRTFDWQIDKTCKMARMDQATLLAKMEQYGIRPDHGTSIT